MTLRRDRNRGVRRALAEQFAGAYRCPDCHAEKALTEHRPGVFVIEVAHDATCPLFAQMDAI